MTDFVAEKKKLIIDNLSPEIQKEFFRKQPRHLKRPFDKDFAPPTPTQVQEVVERFGIEAMGEKLGYGKTAISLKRNMLVGSTNARQIKPLTWYLILLLTAQIPAVTDEKGGMLNEMRLKLLDQYEQNPTSFFGNLEAPYRRPSDEGYLLPSPDDISHLFDSCIYGREGLIRIAGMKNEAVKKWAYPKTDSRSKHINPRTWYLSLILSAKIPPV